MLFFKYKYCTIFFVIIVNSINYVYSDGWWDTIKDNTFCLFTECCNTDYVPYDLNILKFSLEQKIFGQPLVNELVNILNAHKQAVYNKNKENMKALVISLHGLTGVGKTYTTTMIAEALYKNGMNSQYVKLIMGQRDFDSTDLEKSKKELISKVHEVVKNCPKSLIIFEEINNMAPYVLDALKPMLDHHHVVGGVDYRDSIFIFISNIGGDEIASKLLELYSQGKKRSDVEFHNFEAIIKETAYSEGGFEKAALIKHQLIDYYIPFLPLEHEHTEMCARAEFREYGIYQPTDKLMKEALITNDEEPSKNKSIFVNFGCRRFKKHIPYLVQKHKKKNEL